MPHVLIIGQVRAEGIRLLKQRGDVTFEEIGDSDAAAILAHMPKADAVVLRTAPFTSAMIDAAPALKVVSRHGVGFDSVDVDALNARRIPLAVAATSNMTAVAEHALFMMLALSRQVRRYDRVVRKNRWGERNEFTVSELRGKILLIIGFGRIGRCLAPLAKAFGMDVAAYDPLIDQGFIDAAGCRPVADLQGALPDADFVSIHVPRSPSTEGMIDRAALGAMKPSAFLVNTARGGIVDEAALYEALTSGAIKGAGIDVFDVEPPAGNPLFELDNVLLSPHLAGLTAEAAVRMATEAVGNALAGLDGRLDPAVVVNTEAL